MNVLIINGHIRWARVSTGRLNRKINHMTAKVATDFNHKVKYCEADRFYTPFAEVDKFRWADKIIVHFPVNWFGVPGKFKTYLDTVLMAGDNELYQGDGREQGGIYGSGGLLNGKQYFLIATWGAPLRSFEDPFTFFGGAQPDVILMGTHKIFRFLGMESEGSFHFLDVNKSKSVADDLKKCQMKLNEFLMSRNVIYRQ